MIQAVELSVQHELQVVFTLGENRELDAGRAGVDDQDRHAVDFSVRCKAKSGET